LPALARGEGVNCAYAELAARGKAIEAARIKFA
jgi:hypothetical protein